MLLVEDIILVSKIEGRLCGYVRTGNSGVWHQLGIDGSFFVSRNNLCKKNKRLSVRGLQILDNTSL
jgi:hypothetical protein